MTIVTILMRRLFGAQQTSEVNYVSKLEEAGLPAQPAAGGFRHAAVSGAGCERVPLLRASALYLITDGEATTAVELAEPVTADKLIVVGAADGSAELRF